MGPLDALIHIGNFFLSALGVGLISAFLVKRLWRQDLAGVAFSRLAVWAVSAGALVLIGGLVITGRDGRMVTYGAMVIACALALLWAGWKRH
jgi:hypothetical protein